MVQKGLLCTVLGGLVLGACNSPTTQVEGLCLASFTLAEGSTYVYSGDVQAGSFDQAAPLAQVEVQRECDDTGAVGGGLGPAGQVSSNVLAVGTPIYALDGTPTATSLVARLPEGDWARWDLEQGSR